MKRLWQSWTVALWLCFLLLYLAKALVLLLLYPRQLYTPPLTFIVIIVAIIIIIITAILQTTKRIPPNLARSVLISMPQRTHLSPSYLRFQMMITIWVSPSRLDFWVTDDNSRPCITSMCLLTLCYYNAHNNIMHVLFIIRFLFGPQLLFSLAPATMTPGGSRSLR